MFQLPASVSRFGSFCFFGSSVYSAVRVALSLPVSASVSGVSGPAASGAVQASVSRGQYCSLLPVSPGVASVVAGLPACLVICPSSRPVFVSGASWGWSWWLVSARSVAGGPSLLVLPRSLRLPPFVFSWLRSLGWSPVVPGLWGRGLPSPVVRLPLRFSAGWGLVVQGRRGSVLRRFRAGRVSSARWFSFLCSQGGPGFRWS